MNWRFVDVNSEGDYVQLWGVLPNGRGEMNEAEVWVATADLLSTTQAVRKALEEGDILNETLASK